MQIVRTQIAPAGTPSGEPVLRAREKAVWSAIELLIDLQPETALQNSQ